ncbi:Eukaryotic translation initiation factor 4E [Tetrabaena socialis]|uniref:mRNA cap-binding protein n=1 Tax=Tetrabaena socialis TaxID=47790 RepID=A0A2J7ZM65_9CHLO|nr:Eukaryotic translation initiation factor 4E [Tetrabaena socialis]PNH01355.1 Eukaryotic translation initiation factor 4E [Tetrabaena socialis]|eukprot:PNH00915.1 Eukaryotic translation initiation factor 4E [Tetrabaena socialis]
MPGDVYLNDVWTLYFHKSDDTDWTLSSYVRLTDISTVGDFWTAHACIQESLPENMFFLMREGIYPCWDDPRNMYGGCISLKVSKADACRAWEGVCSRVLGETMLTGADWESVNGVSISPKKYFSIVKVWLKNGENNRPEEFATPPWYSGEILYRSHMDCIKASTEKLR